MPMKEMVMIVVLLLIGFYVGMKKPTLLASIPGMHP